MPVITCMAPGCSRPIHYEKGDIEVPLYCEKHRTEDGRHSATRTLIAPKKPEAPKPTVIVRCTNRACRHKIPILKSDWMRNGKEIRLLCPKCQFKMLYHKDA